MEQQNLQQKIAYLEFVNDQLVSENLQKRASLLDLQIERAASKERQIEKAAKRAILLEIERAASKELQKVSKDQRKRASLLDLRNSISKELQGKVILKRAA